MPDEVISIQLEQDLICKLAILAHERDMKLNDLFIEIIGKETDRILNEAKSNTKE